MWSLTSIGFLVVLVTAQAKPQHAEGTRELELQSSSNAVPRIGRRAPVEKKDMRYVPSFTSGLIPRFPLLNPKQGKRDPTEKRAPWAAVWPNFDYSKSAKVRNGKTSETNEEKRAPWTSSWANIVYKPDTLRKSKKSAVPDAWNSPWEHFLKSKQGFRLTDGHDSYLNNAVLYKRAQNHIQELNSVPMLGKREPELPFFGMEDAAGDINDAESTLELDDEDDWFNLGFDDGLRGDNAALYPPVVGPHYRTILTRVQRAVNNNNNINENQQLLQQQHQAM